LRTGFDCLARFRLRVTEASLLDDADLDAVDDEVEALIDNAVSTAKAAPAPVAADLLTQVYVRY
jgi:pyruvate dehydrogenase E1 component alpha subunit